MEQLNGPQREHNKTIRIDMDKNKTTRVFIAQLAQLSTGMLMGEEDTVALSNYTKTARCKSLKGTAYCISSAHFFDLCQASDKVQTLIDKRQAEKLSSKIT